MRRKIGVILMSLATTVASAWEVQRQLGNLNSSLTEWTARHFQPALFFVGDAADDANRHAPQTASLQDHVPFSAEPTESTCDSVPATKAVKQNEPAKSRAPRRAAVESASANHRAGKLPGATDETLRRQSHEERAKADNKRRHELWQQPEAVAAELSRALDSQEVKIGFAKLQASSGHDPMRLMRELERVVRVRKAGMPVPPTSPRRRAKAAPAVASAPEFYRYGFQTGTNRREARIVKRVFGADAGTAEQPIAVEWPASLIDDGAGHAAGLDEHERPRR